MVSMGHNNVQEWPGIITKLWLFIAVIIVDPWVNFIYMYNYMHSKMRNEIAYPFQNFNGYTVEIWEWISNFTS